MLGPFKRSLKLSIGDGCAHSVMLGMGETYLIAFAVALNVENLYIGILASLPVLLGAFSQSFAVSILDRTSKRKPFIVYCAFLQGMWWIFLYGFPVYFWKSHQPFFTALFLILNAIFYFVFGNLVSPLWNSLMGDIVPFSIRGRYFGFRNKLRMFSELFSHLLAGVILLLFDRRDLIVVGFGAIFFVAFTSRLISSWLLSRMEDPPYEKLPKAEAFSFFDFIKQWRTSNFAKYTLFVALLIFATNIASPFFTVYMLRDLNFTYLEFTFAAGISLFAQAVTFQNWGKISDQYGNFRIISITSVAVCLLPLLWLTTTHYGWILFFQALGGCLWAGFNLCTINFIFDAVRPQKLARCMTYYNILSHMGVFLGALLGGILSGHLHSTHTYWIHVPGHPSVFPVLFVLSGFVRILVVLLCLRLIIEVRQVPHTSSWRVVRHMIGLSVTPEFATRFISLFFRRGMSHPKEKS